MARSARKRASRSGIFSAKGPQASQLRRRKHALARQFALPDDLLGGSLNLVHRKCGKASCRCATGDGHAMWTLTYSVEGKRHVEFIPEDLFERVQPLAERGRDYRDALRELLALNAQLLTLWRTQQREAKKKSSK